MSDWIVEYDTCNNGCGTLFFDGNIELDDLLYDIADELHLIMSDTLDEAEADISRDDMFVGYLTVMSNGEWDFTSY